MGNLGDSFVPPSSWAHDPRRDPPVRWCRVHNFPLDDDGFCEWGHRLLVIALRAMVARDKADQAGAVSVGRAIGEGT